MQFDWFSSVLEQKWLEKKDLPFRTCWVGPGISTLRTSPRMEVPLPPIYPNSIFSYFSICPSPYFMMSFDSSFSSFSNVVTTSEDRRNNEKNTSNSSAMEVNSNESVTITSPTKSDITDKSGIIIGEQMKLNFFNSLKQRGFDTICLLNGNDADIFDFIQVSFELF